MGDMVNVSEWREALTGSLTQAGTTIVAFLPNLLAALVITAVGWLISRLIQSIARRLLARLGVDRLSDRLKLAEPLERAGIESSPSVILGRLVFWVFMLTFILSAIEALRLDAVADTVNQLIRFLPNVIAATLILLVGLLLGRVLQNVIRSGAAVTNVAQAPYVAAAANAVVVLVVVVLALEQLGIETTVLVQVLTVLVGVVGLTMGLAFALGSRVVIGHILAGHYLRQRVGPDTTIEVLGRRGTVEEVGAVDTRLRDGQKAWSIPNAQLLEEIVER